MNILDKIIMGIQITAMMLLGMAYNMFGGFIVISLWIKSQKKCVPYLEYYPDILSVGAMMIVASPICFFLAWVISTKTKEVRNEKEKKLEASSPAGDD